METTSPPALNNHITQMLEREGERVLKENSISSEQHYKKKKKMQKEKRKREREKKKKKNEELNYQNCKYSL